MALNKAQLDDLSNLEGFAKDYNKGAKAAAMAQAEIALVMIPGGGVIKLGRMGSKLASTAYKRLADAFGSGVRLVTKPSAKQIQNAKPPSTVLKADGTPKANVTLKSPTQVATNRLAAKAAQKREAQSRMRQTATVEKVPPKPAVPGLGGKAKRVDNKPDAPKKPSKVKSTRTLKEDVKAAAKKRAAQQRMRQAQKRKAAAKKVAGGTAVAAGLGVGAAALNQATKPKKAEASKRRATGTYDRSAVATGKPKPKAKTPNTKKMPARGRPSTQKMDTKGISPTGRPSTQKLDTKGISTRGRPSTQRLDTKGISTTGKPKAKTPNTKKMPPKGRAVTAGSNVGFGPKGDIFPKDAADRRRLMAMYGGTGSAAAKAAAQGKQGNLKKGKK